MNPSLKRASEEREAAREKARQERNDWTAPEHSRDARSMQRIRGDLRVDGRPDVLKRDRLW